MKELKELKEIRSWIFSKKKPFLSGKHLAIVNQASFKDFLISPL